MKKTVRLLILSLVMMGLSACSFDSRHNEKHLHEWSEALHDIHMDIDYFFLEPK